MTLKLWLMKRTRLWITLKDNLGNGVQVVDSKYFYAPSRECVDNFVDILARQPRDPDETRVCAGLPANQASRESYMNQQLASATGFVASAQQASYFLRAAAQLLCISQAGNHFFALDKSRGVVLMTQRRLRQLRILRECA